MDITLFYQCDMSLLIINKLTFGKLRIEVK